MAVFKAQLRAGGRLGGLTTILACRLARRNLGGMSGDIAGFSITLGELSGLLILAIF